VSPPENRHPLAVEFGHRVQVMRVERRLSRMQLANLLGVSEHRVGRIERGDGLSDLAMVVALRDALGCEWDELMGGLSTQ
jgi:transcriptional regulator with XRE-family HTH domain